MTTTLGLTERQRAFVREYQGEGDGVRAARAAGYAGNDRTLAVQAAKNLRHEGVRAALADRDRAAAAARAEATAALATGWTTTARLGALRELAEHPATPPRDRIRAIALASEITGDLGRGRLDPPPPPPSAGAPPPEPASELDEGVHVPARLLTAEEARDGR